LVGVRGETGDQTDQESRSACHGAATSLTAMDIATHGTWTMVGPARRVAGAQRRHGPKRRTTSGPAQQWRQR
jgi:hypothetical protein